MTKEQFQCFAWALGAYFVEKQARELDDAEQNESGEEIVTGTVLWHQAIDAMNEIEDTLKTSGYDAQEHFARMEEEMGMSEAYRRMEREADDGGLYAAYAEQDRIQALRCTCGACVDEDEYYDNWKSELVRNRGAR